MTTAIDSTVGPSGIEHSVPECYNCLAQVEYLVRVRSYEACEECMIKAELPWWDR